MAECNIQQLYITNATTTVFNDTYTKGEGDINGFSYWVGDTNGYYIFAVLSGPPGNFCWGVTDDVEAPIILQNGYIFYCMGFVYNPIVDCPPENTYQYTVGTAVGTATLSYVSGGGGSEPTFGLPAGVVAQMVAAHGSVANFLRLRNLGQI